MDFSNGLIWDSLCYVVDFKMLDYFINYMWWFNLGNGYEW